MKKLLSVLLIGAMLLGILVSCKNDEKKNASLCDQYYDETDVVTNLVRMNISYTDSNGKKQTGDIVVELNPTAAPITVKNFQKLVGEGFYDGLIFHRVIKDFMIQGGDPKGNGTGGSGTNIKGEFSANGISNPIQHTRGVISMARSQANDSASSQFFIMHQDAPHLNGQYAAFGKVVFGIEMVDIIAGVATDRNDKPLNQVTINYMTFVVPKGEKPTEATTAAPSTTAPVATEAPTTAPTEEPTTSAQ